MHTLFISDLHLAAERPQVTEQFLRLTRDTAPAAAALYILGDLFEYWVGDDDLDDPLNGAVSGALAALANRGCQVFLMRGNRDVLLGAAFASALRCHAA
jgi:UDP-2,3-diacylglucosamine hydrolase